MQISPRILKWEFYFKRMTHEIQFMKLCSLYFEIWQVEITLCWNENWLRASVERKPFPFTAFSPFSSGTTFTDMSFWLGIYYSFRNSFKLSYFLSHLKIWDCIFLNSIYSYKNLNIKIDDSKCIHFN